MSSISVNKPFNPDHVIESILFFNKLDNSLYSKINEVSKSKPNLVRAAAPLIGLTLAATGLAKRVSAVGEAVIKGLTNILGAPFSNKFDALKGLKQILVSVPFFAFSLVVSPIILTIGAGITTTNMILRPEEYSNKEIKSLEKVANKFNQLIDKNYIIQKADILEMQLNYPHQSPEKIKEGLEAQLKLFRFIYA